MLTEKEKEGGVGVGWGGFHGKYPRRHYVEISYKTIILTKHYRILYDLRFKLYSKSYTWPVLMPCPI
jgi:hypothetical protein